ncbi:MAG: DNA internalization-related competence protein ComEC/Rec2 [bacterium]|nr:DNA internalization-related competence protein ComEC/Rec2 [bacterium]
MKILRIVLQCKVIYYCLFFVTIIYAIFSFGRDESSKFDGTENYIEGVITKINMKSTHLALELQSLEKVTVTYYSENCIQDNYRIGDIVSIVGTLEKPSHNTIPNLFDYADYLKYKQIYWIVRADSIHKIGKSNHIYYLFKNWMIDRIDTYQSANYLKTFLLGDTQGISDSVINSYQYNGISHLFSISGMHITLLSSIFLFLLKRIFSMNFSRIFSCILLFFYMLLVGCSSSIRAVIFFILLTFYKCFHIKMSTSYIFLLMICLVTLYRPFILMDVGFQYSSIISFYLLQMKKEEQRFWKKLFITSIFSFLISFPISVYYFYQVNFLSVFYNLFFVPVVSTLIFPFSLITFLFPCLDPFFCWMTKLIENISWFCSTISIGVVHFMRPSLIFIIIYYLILFFVLKNKKYCKMILAFLILFLYCAPILVVSDRVMMIDVGQGDCFLIQSKRKTVLMDTGGKFAFGTTKTDLAKDQLIPFFHSIGITKIDYLILSHGDYDHMGEAINLVNNFKVEKVIFNCGEFNDLEQDLIKVLDMMKISYYSCIKELNIGDNKLYFLNNKIYDNENDNSNVIYTEINSYKFMFMGDAGVEVEEDLIEKYNLRDIDILKVGHHGSKTSSSKTFIDEINPKFSIISVGKNNRYGHPNDNVLDNLEGSKIYRTDQDGSVMLKIKKNKLEIETCTP